MQSRTLSDVKNRLNSVGWFVPPYVSTGFIDMVALTIARGSGEFTQLDLERVLARVYDAERLASMVLNRYPNVPVIMLFTQTISEAVMAHFSGLHHVAVGGLIPVVPHRVLTLSNCRSIARFFSDMANSILCLAPKIGDAAA
jgi:hypothetical protein